MIRKNREEQNTSLEYHKNNNNSSKNKTIHIPLNKIQTEKLLNYETVTVLYVIHVFSFLMYSKSKVYIFLSSVHSFWAFMFRNWISSTFYTHFMSKRDETFALINFFRASFHRLRWFFLSFSCLMKYFENFLDRYFCGLNWFFFVYIKCMVWGFRLEVFWSYEFNESNFPFLFQKLQFRMHIG